MNEPPNPFAAPLHDSPPPAPAAARSPRHPALTVLAVLEFIGAAVLAAIGVFGFVTESPPRTMEMTIFVIVMVLLGASASLCAAGGWTLLKGPTRRQLLLQLVPAFWTAIIIYALVTP